MKKVLAALIAALMICIALVPAQAAVATPSLADYLSLVNFAIKTFGETGARIHEAYADTLQKAMDYRKYYNEQGLAKAYEKMQVSMMNQGTPRYNTVLNTTNNTFYDMSRDYTYTYNTAYYNNTYNSYYIPVTYNDVDYNYFITYAPTYTNITYIVDGCNDPSQAVSNNYYFQLPDGRNSYDLTADEVFGIPLAGDVVNYDAVPENDNCVALYHFDGNIVDASGNGNAASFTEGTVPQYVSSSGFNDYLTLSNDGQFVVSLVEGVQPPYTVEFRLNLGSVLNYKLPDSDFYVDPDSFWYRSGYGYFVPIPGVQHSATKSNYPNVNEDDKNIYLVANAAYALKFKHSVVGLGSYSSSGSDVLGSICSVSENRSFFAFSESQPGYFIRFEGTDVLAQKVKYGYIPSNIDEISESFKYNNSIGRFNRDAYSYPNDVFDPLPQGQWVSLAFIVTSSGVRSYANGVEFAAPENWELSSGMLKSFAFTGLKGLSYSFIDELRISKGALYAENYTPATAPFDIPMALVLPSEKAEGTIAVKSAMPVANVRLGGVRPSYPAQGDVYISLDADKKVTSCQQYQSGTWTECQGSVCSDDAWVELAGYSFAGQVVNEDDFAEVVDKKEDPAAGTDANPEAEATSFTVHYYKEGTTDKVRRDTVYENLAVGAAFTASAPTVKGYKALVASADITVAADGEYILYYSVDESTDPGGSGGDDDPSKPGFFDGLLSGVKSLVNVICSFVGGVVQAVLSGITGIISTLIEAFKAVLSLGGHFGDFLAAALGFVPREIIDLLIAGIAVSIALAIVKFIRG